MVRRPSSVRAAGLWRVMLKLPIVRLPPPPASAAGSKRSAICTGSISAPDGSTWIRPAASSTQNGTRWELLATISEPRRVLSRRLRRRPPRKCDSSYSRHTRAVVVHARLLGNLGGERRVAHHDPAHLGELAVAADLDERLAHGLRVLRQLLVVDRSAALSCRSWACWYRASTSKTMPTLASKTPG